MTDSSSEASTEQRSKSSSSHQLASLFAIWRQACLSRSRPPDSLQREARTTFTKLSQHTSIQLGDQVVSTSFDANQALAQLLASLDAVFTASTKTGDGVLRLAPRRNALFVLLGSLQGCQQQQKVDLFFAKLTAKFLLPHIGPLVARDDDGKDMMDDDDDVDVPEQMRDVALQCLTTMLVSVDITISRDNADTLAWLLDTARQGLQHRCAENSEVPRDVDDDPYNLDNADDYDDDDPGLLFQGLPTLPRSRRSSCFALLRACMDSATRLMVHHTGALTNDADAVAPNLSRFAELCALCLHGESDPRCLRQVLQLLHAVQTGWAPVLGATTCFPVTAYLDAIAPYYPIQFTPPPTHTGSTITRAGLQQALMNVMSCTIYDHQGTSSSSMLDQSLGLVLERLLPHEIDEAPTLTDLSEGVQDLQTLLSDKVELVNDESLLRSVSSTLVAVHEQASLLVAQGDQDSSGGGTTIKARQVGNDCRQLAVDLARQAERLWTKGADKKLWQSRNSSAWKALVAEPLRQLSIKLPESPSQHSAALAYLANLASSGAPRTVQHSLQAGLRPLLRGLADSLWTGRPQEQRTALFGIGAFFAAAHTSVQRAARRDGVSMHPHPLQPYAKDAIRQLLPYLDQEVGSNQPPDGDIVNARTAAVRALESVLGAAPSSALSLSDNNSEQLTDCIKVLAQVVVGKSPQSLPESDDEWRKACTKTIGGLLGRALDDVVVDTDGNASWVHSHEPMRIFFGQELLPLLTGVPPEESAGPTSRYGVVLAIAASLGAPSAQKIVEALIESLIEAIRRNIADSHILQERFQSIGFVIHKGGMEPSKALQAMVEGKCLILDVYYSVLEHAAGYVPKSDQNNDAFGMSMLELPPSSDTLHTVASAIDIAHQVMVNFGAVYKGYVSKEHVHFLLLETSKLFPPLSYNDTLKLTMLLQLLSTALPHLPSDWIATGPPDLSNAICAMLPEMSAFALTLDFPGFSRASAVSCIESIMSATDEGGMLSTKSYWIENVVGPMEVALLSRNKDTKASSAAMTLLRGGLELSAALAAASIRRGGPSVNTAEAIVNVLVLLACTGEAAIPATSGGKTCCLGLSICDPSQLDDLQMTCAALVGKVLATVDKILFRQRLGHRVLQCINTTINGGGNKSAAVLGIIAHVGCWCQPKALGSTTARSMLTKLIDGIGPAGVLVSNDEFQPTWKVEQYTSTRALVLAAILRFIVSAPEALQGLLRAVVAGAMRAYASCRTTTTEIECKIMALQLMDAVTLLQRSQSSELHALKPAVVGILESAMNDPFPALRAAGVTVRNTWYLV